MAHEPKPGRRQGRSWLAGALVCWPCLLCCLIAARQFWAASHGPLSPWKGGGFGMFAATDHPGNRVLHCVGTTSDGEQVVVRFGSLPPGAPISPGTVRRLHTYPTEADLQALAGALLPLDYVRTDTSSRHQRYSLLAQNPGLSDNVPTLPDWPVTVVAPRDLRLAGHPEADSLTLTAIEAGIWRVRFSSDDHTLRTELMLRPVRATRTKLDSADELTAGSR